MVSKNSVLLIVKQNPGIDYHSLLNKFSSSYSNLNSARAALSRTLKDLSTFGFIYKTKDNFFLAEKGESEIYSQIKNKLVLALNSLLKGKKPENDVDEIVSKMHVLIERSKEDKALCKTARSSAEFRISELNALQNTVEERAKHLSYLSKIFEEQISSLKELDFFDSLSLINNNETIRKLLTILADSELLVETNPEFLEKIAKKFNVEIKKNSIKMSQSSFPELASFSQKDSFKAGKIIVFSSAIKIEFNQGKILITGPYSELKKIT